MGRLTGRVAIVTGSGRGIGRATALLFAREGARVVVNDIDAGPARAVGEEIAAAGGHGHVVAGDAADPRVAGQLADAAADVFGGLDVLVNNAGTTRDAAFHAMDPALWSLVQDAALGTTVEVTRACLPLLRDRAASELARDGTVAHQRKITNTAAAGFLTGSPGQANLNAAGGAVVGLTRTLARELGGFGINVNVVVPGFVTTRLTDAQTADGVLGVPESIRQMTKAVTALGRYGTPDDLARVHLFLAGTDADFVSGATIPVTGGMLGT